MSHWFQYFPAQFMWSQGVMSAIEMIPFGAAAMGEIDQVGQRLRERIGDNDAWGGHFDYHESWIRCRREIESGGTRVSAPYFHLLWVLGVSDMDAAMKKLEQFRLAGVAERISCPFLCVHGENDTIVPVDYARRLFSAVGATDKTLHVFDADEGGSEHCQGDNRILGATFVADWLSDRLVKGRAIVG
jgi:pimeloyl-ACP methyl ester carboxylesterase